MRKERGESHADLIKGQNVRARSTCPDIKTVRLSVINDSVPFFKKKYLKSFTQWPAIRKCVFFTHLSLSEFPEFLLILQRPHLPLACKAGFPQETLEVAVKCPALN